MRLLLALLAFSAFDASAQDDVSEGLSVGFGQVTIGSEVCFDGLLVTQELAERKFLLTLSTHGEGVCREEFVRANIGFGIMRMVPLGKWAFGIGIGLYEHGDRGVGPLTDQNRIQLTAHLGIRRYLFNERVVVDLLHASSGGSTHWNPGLNGLYLGARF